MTEVTFSHRHLVILGFAAALGCGGSPAPSAPVPVSPPQAVEQFLAAANAENLQRMGELWGDEHGPNRSGPQNVRTQRLTIIQRLVRGEAHEIVATDATTPSRPKLSVTITQGTRRFTVPFTLAQWHGGWLVKEIGIDQAMPTAGSQPR